MFRPNTTCALRKKSASADIYGRKSYSPAVDVPCAIVTYDLSTHKSSVRADSAGSRGRAEGVEGTARFLFPLSVIVKRGDRILKDGYDLEVIEIHPRRSVLGPLDHNEVDMRPFIAAS